MEVFSTDGSHMYLIFNSPKERDLFYEQIVQQPGMRVYTKKMQNLCSALKQQSTNNNILLESCKQFREIKLMKYSSPQYISHFVVFF